LTQAELASEVGCAVVTIQKIEAARRRPSKQMAEKLAAVLQIPLADNPAFLAFARLGSERQRFVAAQNDGRHAGLRGQQRPANLPWPTTRLIGREQQLALIKQRLATGSTRPENSRLLTLVGPPGVGKTRLAIEVAAGLVYDFSDGVYFVSLVSINNPEEAAQTIAQALGVNEIGDRGFESRLKEYLADKHLLLVLDNFEHILPAALLVSTLLAACPWLTVMATSRVPLAIRGERQFLVPPLTLPDDHSPPDDPQRLLDYSAVALFVERAQDTTPDFALTAGVAGAIVDLCARLDGLPLAIELVATRTSRWPVQTVLEKLQGRTLLETAWLRDLAERHRTLYQAIDWSYGLLDPGEQRLLACLSVFNGGWTAEAAASVLGGRPVQAALDQLCSLASKNLVVLMQRDDDPRFSMLQTIRTYAQERLAASGEETAVHRRHAAYYLSLAEQASPHLRTASQMQYLDCMEEERGNFRQALSWFLNTAGDSSRGLRLASALAWFWNMRSHVGEGRYWLARALQTGDQNEANARIQALISAGGLALQQGDLAAARAYSDKSIALCRRSGRADSFNLGLALTGLANIALYQLDAEAVYQAASEALSLFRQLGDRWGMGLAQCLLGEVPLLGQDSQTARDCFAKGLAWLRPTGDHWATGIALMDLGYANLLLGDLATAQAQLEESVALLGAVGERFFRALSLNFLAQLGQQQGEFEQTAALYRESLDLLRKMGVDASIADVQFNLARFVQAHGYLDLAGRLYRECLALFGKQGNMGQVAQCEAGLAAVGSQR
jgi:predicted ATPase